MFWSCSAESRAYGGGVVQLLRLAFWLGDAGCVCSCQPRLRWCRMLASRRGRAFECTRGIPRVPISREWLKHGRRSTFALVRRFCCSNDETKSVARETRNNSPRHRNHPTSTSPGFTSQVFQAARGYPMAEIRGLVIIRRTPGAKQCDWAVRIGDRRRFRHKTVASTGLERTGAMRLFAVVEI